MKAHTCEDSIESRLSYAIWFQLMIKKGQWIILFKNESIASVFCSFTSIFVSITILNLCILNNDQILISNPKFNKYSVSFA